MGTHALFKRYEGNPIITAEDVTCEAHTVFNPAATKFDNKVLLVLRVEEQRGFSYLIRAFSDDGINNWKIDNKPFMIHEPQMGEQLWGLEDPRITYMEEFDQHYLTYVSFAPGGPQLSLVTTRDFERVCRHGNLFYPDNKDGAFYPKRFNGRWALIHRPYARGRAEIWLSFTPDLKHYGDHTCIIPVREGWWDCTRVGMGPPPIETPEGWLLIYHGVRTTASGSLYRVGMALFDLDDPTKLIYRTNRWVLAPETPYELIGDVPGVCFPCGAICNENTREIMLYYGGADTTTCVAFSTIDDILDFIKEDQKIGRTFYSL